jgi:hypothetical protein
MAATHAVAARRSDDDNRSHEQAASTPFERADTMAIVIHYCGG